MPQLDIYTFWCQYTGILFLFLLIYILNTYIVLPLVIRGLLVRASLVNQTYKLSKLVSILTKPTAVIAVSKEKNFSTTIKLIPSSLTSVTHSFIAYSINSVFIEFDRNIFSQSMFVKPHLVKINYFNYLSTLVLVLLSTKSNLENNDNED